MKINFYLYKNILFRLVSIFFLLGLIIISVIFIRADFFNINYSNIKNEKIENFSDIDKLNNNKIINYELYDIKEKNLNFYIKKIFKYVDYGTKFKSFTIDSEVYNLFIYLNNDADDIFLKVNKSIGIRQINLNLQPFKNNNSIIINNNPEYFYEDGNYKYYKLFKNHFNYNNIIEIIVFQNLTQVKKQKSESNFIGLSIFLAILIIYIISLNYKLQINLLLTKYKYLRNPNLFIILSIILISYSFTKYFKTTNTIYSIASLLMVICFYFFVIKFVIFIAKYKTIKEVKFILNMLGNKDKIFSLLGFIFLMAMIFFSSMGIIPIAEILSICVFISIFLSLFFSLTS